MYFALAVLFLSTFVGVAEKAEKQPEKQTVVVGKVVNAAGDPGQGAEVSVYPANLKGPKIKTRTVLPDGTIVTRTETKGIIRGFTEKDGTFRIVVKPSTNLIVNVQTKQQGNVAKIGALREAGLFAVAACLFEKSNALSLAGDRIPSTRTQHSVSGNSDDTTAADVSASLSLKTILLLPHRQQPSWLL